MGKRWCDYWTLRQEPAPTAPQSAVRKLQGGYCGRLGLRVGQQRPVNPGSTWRVSQGQLPTSCRTRAALVLSPGLERVKGGALCAVSFRPSSLSVKVLFLHLLIAGAQALAKPQF